MRTATLSEIAKIKSGCPAGKLSVKTENEGIEIKVVSIKDIDASETTLNCERIESSWINDSEVVEKYKLVRGQVLITAKGQSIRAQAYLTSEAPALPHTNLFVISDLSNEVLPEYLALYLSLEPVVESMRGSLVGTTIFSLSKKDLEKVEIKLPNIDDQKKLVEFSTSGKKLIQARKQEIESVSLLMKQTLVNQIIGEM